MAANNRGGMRPNGAGKTPSFIVIGLLVVIAILGFNYWNVSSKNSVLVSELAEMSEHMRMSSVKKLSVEKRNDALLQKVRENEQELNNQKSLAQRKDDEINSINSQFNSKKSECETQQQELNSLRQEYDLCRSSSQDMEAKLDQANEAKSDCEVKCATAKEECEKRVQAASANQQAPQDCTEQMKTSQVSLLNIIHKLWGNKAIIVLQDAGIDVSGIQLNTDGGGQLPTGGRDQQIAEGDRQQQQQAQQQAQQQQQSLDNTQDQQQQGQVQYPAQGKSQGQGQYPQQGQGQYQQQGQGQYPQDSSLNKEQQGAYPAANQQGEYPAVKQQAAYPAVNQQGAYPAVNQQGVYPAVNQHGEYPAVNHQGPNMSQHTQQGGPADTNKSLDATQLKTEIPRDAVQPGNRSETQNEGEGMRTTPLQLLKKPSESGLLNETTPPTPLTNTNATGSKLTLQEILSSTQTSLNVTTATATPTPSNSNSAGVQRQDQEQQSWQQQQHQEDNQQAMAQQPINGSPGQVGQVQAPVDRNAYIQQQEDAAKALGQDKPADAPAEGQPGMVQADQGQLGVQPAGAGAPDAPADREQVQAPESRVVPAAPDQHQAPQGQEGALQPPPQDGAAAVGVPPGAVDSNAANEVNNDEGLIKAGPAGDNIDVDENQDDAGADYKDGRQDGDAGDDDVQDGDEDGNDDDGNADDGNADGDNADGDNADDGHNPDDQYDSKGAPADQQDSRRQEAGNLQFRPNEQGEVGANEGRIDNAALGRQF